LRRLFTRAVALEESGAVWRRRVRLLPRQRDLDLGIFPTDKSSAKLVEPRVAAAPLAAVLMPRHPTRREDRVPETVVAWRPRPPAHLRALIPGVRDLGSVRERRPGTRWHTLNMTTAAEIVLAVLVLLPVLAVGVVFVWAARRDGQDDRALQARLGIRRRTRLGR